ncbi:TIGR04283 family arsenosugar biosynthesis glycosyltransferase [Synechocystis sp. LKSZ1]|uniref:TIGR04283 family arsenosugar biosynthesis glycosyltransferase n=1 Tax=Synechocystis sp. LKSZ1 TaxID=3144951 RepID=UPI00336BC838
MAYFKISIIIPVLNEAAILHHFLARFPFRDDREVILVDGGSQDQTLALAQAFPINVVPSPQPGRGHQLNYGASLAQAEILLFLHLDTVLPIDFQDQIVETLGRPGVIAGAFRFRVDLPGLTYRCLEQLVNWRSQAWNLPYGDQGLFVRARTFRALGGFAALPIMEDYEWVQRAKARGRIGLAQRAILTSGRRWQKLGLLRTTLINQVMILGYHAGIDPTRLAQWYRQGLRG